MGNEIPKVEVGASCAACFPDGYTPKRIHVLFAGVLKCPAKDWPSGGDLNQLWTLEQVPGFPCKYLYDEGLDGWTIALFISIGGGSYLEAQMKILGPFDVGYFVDSNPTECSKYFTNEYDGSACGFGFRAYNGHAYIQELI